MDQFVEEKVKQVVQIKLVNQESEWPLQKSKKSYDFQFEKEDQEKKVEQQAKYQKHDVQCGGMTFRIYTHYEVFKVVGQGAYGVVSSGRNKLTNSSAAIKKIPNLFNDLTDAKRVLREIKLLSNSQQPIFQKEFFKHKNIVSLLDIILPDDPENFKEIYLVFELMQLDLQHVISSSLVLSDKQINWFMFQIVTAVHHLHSADVIHRDLKPSNILVNKNCDLKIGDLNLARKFDSETNFITDYVVTRWYRAPEVILSQSEYTKAIDLWSVGCILAELLGRTILFEGQNPVEQIEKIVAVLGTPKEEDLPYKIEQRTQNYLNQLPKRNPVDWNEVFPYANPLSVDLVAKLLVYNPEKRLNALQCLQHPFFAELYIQYPPIACKESFDWSFDMLDPNKKILVQRIYDEAKDYQ